MYQATTALTKIAALKKRISAIQGGTSAGKTIAILLLLIQKAQTEKCSITIASESLPHLKRGAMRDFFDILREHNYYKEDNHNKSDHIYNFETGSYVEFFGVDEPEKVRGPRRDILFINECNNVPYGVFDQMEVRTKQRIYLDYNPVGEFWLHSDVLPTTDIDLIKLTYKDNEALDERVVQSIESRKGNENWWRVFGLGEMGHKEGQIYHWDIVDSIPKEARLERYWLDFGYTNDPTAIGALYYHNGGYIVDELKYQSGMTNADIANFLLSLDTDVLTVADSAEPKSIDEIARYGVRIIGAVKGQGSVNYGIDLVQAQKVSVTKRSDNIIKEQRNYLWKLDRDGKPLNVPEGGFDHHMDGIRYAFMDLLGNPMLESGDFAFL